MTITLRVIGAVLILISLQDQFQTLFHPAGRGALSDWTGKIVWKTMRFFARRNVGRLTLAGPFALLLIIVIWAGLLCLGWACLIFPQLGSFTVMAGLDPAQHHGFFDALNISVGSLITLGGDMMPTTKGIRFLMSLEGVFGFALLTASVSWLLSIYPVLESGRSFAQEAMSLYNACRRCHLAISDLAESEAHSLIHGLAVQLASVRNQMVQFPVTYYFNVGEKKTSIAAVMPFVAHIAEEAELDIRPGVRLAGSVLSSAVDNFAEFVGSTFLGMPNGNRKAILSTLACDHMRDPVGLELLDNTDHRGEEKKAHSYIDHS
jgi:hypothetical protein